MSVIPVTWDMEMGRYGFRLDQKVYGGGRGRKRTGGVAQSEGCE
jgi:hypothetical protein